MYVSVNLMCLLFRIEHYKSDTAPFPNLFDKYDLGQFGWEMSTLESQKDKTVLLNQKQIYTNRISALKLARSFIEFLILASNSGR